MTPVYLIPSHPTLCLPFASPPSPLQSIRGLMRELMVFRAQVRDLRLDIIEYIYLHVYDYIFSYRIPRLCLYPRPRILSISAFVLIVSLLIRISPLVLVTTYHSFGIYIFFIPINRLSPTYHSYPSDCYHHYHHYHCCLS